MKKSKNRKKAFKDLQEGDKIMLNKKHYAIVSTAPQPIGVDNNGLWKAYLEGGHLGRLFEFPNVLVELAN